MSGKISFLIASARSGKSTYASKWIDDITINNFGAYPHIVVNSDQIRLNLYGERYRHESEPFVHAITDLIVRTYYGMGYHVLVDETNTTKSSIRKWLSIDPDAQAIFIDTPIEICKERAYMSDQADLVEKGFIDKHFRNLIELCYYAHRKDEEAAGRKGLYTYFGAPEADFIYKAVEYIRQEVKEQKI